MYGCMCLPLGFDIKIKNTSLCAMSFDKQYLMFDIVHPEWYDLKIMTYAISKLMDYIQIEPILADVGPIKLLIVN